MGDYRIKIADTDAEREQVHALNYATFVEEIPQHAGNDARRLVDRFDGENTYVVAVEAGGTVQGMVALRSRRPFSLDAKLPGLDDHLPPHRSVCEIRLLAVRRQCRHGRLFRDLVRFAASHCIGEGHDLAVISGTTRQLALYEHLGFEPFGPQVGTREARYQPMVLTLEKFLSRVDRTLGLRPDLRGERRAARFLPGPVPHSGAVRAALAEEAVTHRGGEFRARLGRLRSRLCALAHCRDAVVMVGSGTLANDAVAAQIAAQGRTGLVLANGEFGERLVDHAHRAGLRFEALRRAWGDAFDADGVSAALVHAQAGWLWAVHCETSTGVLNDLEMLKRATAAAGAKLYLDCISTLGAIEVDLAGVSLASASSGKALGAYAGLGIVLLNERPMASGANRPRYLDLGLWLEADGVPFTHSSNLLAALEAALSRDDWKDRYARIARDARWLRHRLRECGLQVLANDAHASPGITTVVMPAAVQASAAAAALEHSGFEVAAHSAYLIQRNWLQVALMGDYDPAALRALPAAIAGAAGVPHAAAPRAA